MEENVQKNFTGMKRKFECKDENEALQSYASVDSIGLPGYLDQLHSAALLLQDAEAILICAGAGLVLFYFYLFISWIYY